MTPKRKVGRPPTPDAERLRIVTEVCKRIAEGDIVIQACETVGIPHPTFRDWSTLPEYSSLYARAREDAADMLADEALKVARATTNETAQADRVRIDTLKWAAAKRKPRYYGDKVDVTSDGKAMAGVVVLPATVG